MTAMPADGALCLMASVPGNGARCHTSRLVACYGRLALALNFIPSGENDNVSAITDLLHRIAMYIRQPPRVISTVIKGSESELRHCAMTRASNGRLYAAPIDTDNVLVHEQQCSRRTYTIQLPVGYLEEEPVGYWGDTERRRSKYMARMCDAGNGVMYVAPYESESVLAVDTRDDTVEKIDIDDDRIYAYTAGMTLASDGKLYCPPHDGSSVLCVDPVCNAVSFLDLPYDSATFGGEMEWWWMGGMYLCSAMYKSELVEYSGVLFCTPYNAPFVLAVDTARQRCIPLCPHDGWGAPQDDREKWAGAPALLHGENGAAQLVCLPADSRGMRGMLVIDCGRAVEQIRNGANACVGCTIEVMRCYQVKRPLFPAETGLGDAVESGSLVPYDGYTKCVGLTPHLAWWGRTTVGMLFFVHGDRYAQYLQLPINVAYSAPVIFEKSAYIIGDCHNSQKRVLVTVNLEDKKILVCPVGDVSESPRFATRHPATGDIHILDIPVHGDSHTRR